MHLFYNKVKPDDPLEPLVMEHYVIPFSLLTVGLGKKAFKYICSTYVYKIYYQTKHIKQMIFSNIMSIY